MPWTRLKRRLRKALRALGRFVVDAGPDPLDQELVRAVNRGQAALARQLIDAGAGRGPICPLAMAFALHPGDRELAEALWDGFAESFADGAALAEAISRGGELDAWVDRLLGVFGPVQPWDMASGPPHWMGRALRMRAIMDRPLALAWMARALGGSPSCAAPLMACMLELGDPGMARMAFEAMAPGPMRGRQCDAVLMAWAGALGVGDGLANSIGADDVATMLPLCSQAALATARLRCVHRPDLAEAIGAHVEGGRGHSDEAWADEILHWAGEDHLRRSIGSPLAGRWIYEPSIMAAPQSALPLACSKIAAHMGRRHGPDLGDALDRACSRLPLDEAAHWIWLAKRPERAFPLHATRVEAAAILAEVSARGSSGKGAVRI